MHSYAIFLTGSALTEMVTMSPGSYSAVLDHSSGQGPTMDAGSKVGEKVGPMDPLQYPSTVQASFHASGVAGEERGSYPASPHHPELG